MDQEVEIQHFDMVHDSVPGNGGGSSSHTTCIASQIPTLVTDS